MNTIKDKATWSIVIAYALWYNLFNFYALSGWAMRLNEIKEVITLVITIALLGSLINSTKSRDLDKNVALLIFMSVFSMFVALLFWNQSLYSSLRVVCSTMFPLMTFFLLKHYNVTLNSIKKAIVLICILHGVLQIIGTITFPNHLFGYVNEEAIERSLIDLEKRGVLRLSIPGSDFVPMTIFMVMVLGRKIPKWYLLLIPLFLILLMRGTRTPFFFTSLICLFYYIMGIKRKIMVFLVGVTAYFALNLVYERLLDSTDDNALVNYVQMTHNQLESNDTGEEDIRVRMAKFFLFDFNEDNIFRVVLGNGVPGQGTYGYKMRYYSNNYSYYVVDVGFVEIFTYFGLVGIVIYLLLFRKAVLITRISNNGMFAKLTILYFFLILPTNSMLISNPIPVAIALYALYISQSKRMLDHC